MKIAFLDTVHSYLWEQLTEADFECVDYTQTELSTILEEVGAFDGIVIRSRFKMDRTFLEKATNLKFIARSGAGMENIDADYAESKNIQLFNAPEGNRNAVGEHALGMLLALFNNLLKADAEVRSGKWDREGNRGYELEGKTVGIIGFGNNGSAFSKILSGFDVDILAYDKYKKGFGNERVQEVELEDIFQRADVLSLHIPQNEETLFMVNKNFIQQFEKPFFIINLSRGKIVKTADLLNAMEDKKILGACLDVLEYEKTSFESLFEGEMNPDFKKLLEHPKVILSPHVGGWTHESYYKLSRVLADKVLAHFG